MRWRACTECARAREKCTKAMPCHRCAAKSLHCVYPDSKYPRWRQPHGTAARSRSASQDDGDVSDLSATTPTGPQQPDLRLDMSFTQGIDMRSIMTAPPLMRRASMAASPMATASATWMERGGGRRMTMVGPTMMSAPPQQPQTHLSSPALQSPFQTPVSSFPDDAIRGRNASFSGRPAHEQQTMAPSYGQPPQMGLPNSQPPPPNVSLTWMPPSTTQTLNYGPMMGLGTSSYRPIGSFQHQQPQHQHQPPQQAPPHQHQHQAQPLQSQQQHPPPPHHQAPRSHYVHQESNSNSMAMAYNSPARRSIPQFNSK